MSEKDNRGALFKNDRKEKETHPDSKGSAMIDGQKYWVSGWWAKSKSGVGYLSLAFTKSDPSPEESPPAGQPDAAPPEQPDLPF